MQRFLATAALASTAISGPTPSTTTAFGLFNTASDALRQWGSSVHHNGLAFMAAEVPAGTLFYHGSQNKDIPEGFEWLAFEVEHAQQFADSFHGKNSWVPGLRPPAGDEKPGSGGHWGPPGGRGPKPKGQKTTKQQFEAKKKRLSASGTLVDGPSKEDPNKGHRGYLHTYAATRPLKLLYLDGMSAAKCDFGPMDSQDLILMANKNITDNHGGEYDRAHGMCELLHPHGIDGILRMEAGFEIIYCDFTDGLQQLSATRQPYADTEAWFGEVTSFQWLKAVSRRYDGIGGGRVQLAWANAVTGWWYGFNTTTTDETRLELHRFIQATAEERRKIRDDVVEMARQDFTPGAVNWQLVADMVTQRFAWRLQQLAREDVADSEFINLALATVAVYFDTPTAPEDKEGSVLSEAETVREAVDRCTNSYFGTVEFVKDQMTNIDEMFYTAFKTVSHTICSSLFTTRATLLSAAPDVVRPEFFPHDRDKSLNRILVPAVPAARKVILDLMKKLDWAEWKRCQGCKGNEECFIAMFPLGTKSDHYHPVCMNDTMAGGHGMMGQNNYWWGDKKSQEKPPKEDKERQVILEL